MRAVKQETLASPVTSIPALPGLVGWSSLVALWCLVGMGCSEPSETHRITDAPVAVATGERSIEVPHGIVAGRSGLAVVDLRSDEPSCTGLPTPEAGHVTVTISVPADRVVAGRHHIESDPLREDDVGLSVTVYDGAVGEAGSTTYIITTGFLELDSVDAHAIRGGVWARDDANDVGIDGRFSAIRCTD